MRGAVSYDATSNGIVFEPAEFLRQATDYVLTMDGVSDEAGNTTPSTQVSFRTFATPQLRRVTYNSSQVPVFQIDYQNDANGREIRFIPMADAGPDNVFDTGDETPRDYTETERDDSGVILRRSLYTRAGDDEVWFTDDDLANTYQAYDNGPIGLPLRIVEWSAGSDRTVGTDDDIRFRYTNYAYNAFGQITKSTAFNGPGDDGEWYTEDDLPEFVSTAIEYDDSGLEVSNVTSVPGPDRVFDTDDDEILVYTIGRIDDAQQRFEGIGYNGPGADDQWFTEDDDISTYRVEMLDSQGRPVSSVVAVAEGDDGIWLTDDDLAEPHQSFEYDDSDPQQTVVTITTFSDAGADGIRFTSDDSINTIRIERRLATSLLVSAEQFRGAGPDGVWRTQDDVYQQIELNNRDTDFNLLRQRFFSGPGPDSVPFTPDDPVFFELRYDTPQ